MRLKWVRLLALLTVLALLAAACGGGDDATEDEGTEEDTATEEETTEEATEEDTEAAAGGGSDEALQFGYILPETGDLAFLGPPQIEAARFAIEQINESGGVLGQELPEIVGSDEAGDEAVANESADRLLAEEVDAVIGAAASGMSLAVIDKLTGAEIVQCSGSNTAPTFTDYDDGGFYFRTAPSDALQGPVLADVIVSDGYANVALVGRADDYGQGLVDSTAAALEEAGASVVLQETYDPESQNFDSVIQSIAGANPDAAVVIGFEEGFQIVAGLIEQGLGPDSIGLYGADGLRSEDLPASVSPDDPTAVAGFKGTAPAPAEDPGFLEALQEFAPDLAETTFAGQVFDCVNIIALAAEQAGSTAPADFAPEIVEVTREGTACTSFDECLALIGEGEDIDYNGASGPLDFIDAGEPGTATIEVYGFNDAGEFESLETVQAEPIEE